MAHRVAQDPSLPPISASTMGRWILAERIRPWRYHAWQHIHDPLAFLQRARPVPTAPIEPRAKTLLEPVKELFPSIKLLWGDSHYGGTLIGWRKRAAGLDRGHCAPSARAAISPEVEWEKLFPSGFRPLPRRWVVERSFAWITRLSSAGSRSRGKA